LNNLVNEKGGISTEMAIRLSKAFGSKAEIWLALQYDLMEATASGKIKVLRINGRRATSG
jgi:antitoxin HigA-1